MYLNNTQKKTLIIGSTVVDVIIGVNKIPKTGEDANTTSHQMTLGGCAFNASEILRLMNSPYKLCSPVGQGAYGEFVIAGLKKRGISPFVKLQDVENGCCYCLVEENGERTFLSNHGAEYLFEEHWMNNVDVSTVDSVYICGLELEEKTGKNIVSWLEKNPNLTIYFACSSRITHIEKTLIQRILKLKPVLHLNEMESFLLAEYLGLEASTLENIAIELHKRTQNDVIITIGSQGCLCVSELSDDPILVPATSVEVVDTIGAGDSHIGAVIGFRKQGFSLFESVEKANKVSAKVVQTKGASLTEAQFNEIEF